MPEAKARKPPTKVVLRRLPPTMTQETLLESIHPVPDHDHMYFVPADRSLGVSATSRAYFSFQKMEDVYIFKEKFHDYVFVDSKGNEYAAVVEFAPFQRMGKVRSKPDRKCNTYETSEAFLEFVRTMDTQEALPRLELKSDFEAKHDNQIRSTPLLEFLNDKKSRKRDKDRKQQQQQQDKKKKILAPIKEDASGPTPKEVAARRPPKEKPSKTAGPPPQRKEEGAAKKERPERSEKEKARRLERDKLRREKRQQMAVEKRRERENKEKESPTSTEPKEATAADGGEPKKAPKEAKKFSERRQENRAKRSEDQQGEMNEGEPPAEKRKESRRYSERRIRNKDRPAIQIYQPGSKARKGDE